MSSISIYDRKHGHCGMTKLIPPEGLSKFTINHYYDQRHVNWVPVFNTDESIKMGGNGQPECWKKIIEENKVKLTLSKNDTNLHVPDQ